MRHLDFDDVAKEMTMIDHGGDAPATGKPQQLSIAEASQGAKVFARVARKHMTIENILGFIAKYGE